MSIAAASGVGNVGLAPLVFYPVQFLYLAVTVVLANLAIWRLRRKLGEKLAAVPPNPVK